MGLLVDLIPYIIAIVNEDKLALTQRIRFAHRRRACHTGPRAQV